eukprot:365248-Chlamydomonas_euryale.AAC.1
MEALLPRLYPLRRGLWGSGRRGTYTYPTACPPPRLLAQPPACHAIGAALSSRSETVADP